MELAREHLANGDMAMVKVYKRHIMPSRPNAQEQYREGDLVRMC